jgi:hypothetical protein
MKSLILIATISLVVSCTSKQSAPDVRERAIGFTTRFPEEKWHLGTETAIQVVKDLNKVWAERDYKAMKSYFVDTTLFYFTDGRIAHSPDEFIELFKSETEGIEFYWTFDYAFSVSLDSTKGGEYVQAGFTGTSVQDGIESRKYYHEWYHVINGKVVMWKEYTLDIKDE